MNTHVKRITGAITGRTLFLILTSIFSFQNLRDKDHVSHGKPSICVVILSHHSLGGRAFFAKHSLFYDQLQLSKYCWPIWKNPVMVFNFMHNPWFLFFSKYFRYSGVEASVTTRELWGSLINCGYERQESSQTLVTYTYRETSCCSVQQIPPAAVKQDCVFWSIKKPPLHWV